MVCKFRTLRMLLSDAHFYSPCTFLIALSRLFRRNPWVQTVVVKTTYPCFIEPLKHILNLSVIYGVFPSELKLAKVIPLYKRMIL